jgi:hypothetical protein
MYWSLKLFMPWEVSKKKPAAARISSAEVARKGRC